MTARTRTGIYVEKADKEHHLFRVRLGSSRRGSVCTLYVLPTSTVLPLESKEPTLPTLLLVGRESSGRGWESPI